MPEPPVENARVMAYLVSNMRNPEEVRENLAKAILGVRSGKATSRRVLAGLLRLSPSTTGDYVDQLIASGYLMESGLEQGAMGRPKRVLQTREEAGWFAGIEFNAERIQAVRVDFSGAQRAALTRPLNEEADATQVMTAIKAMIASLHAGADGPLIGLGIGAPGLVDPASGIAAHYSFLPGWKNMPVRDALARHFSVPVFVENNLRVIALAERWCGGGRELDDYVILGPRSGFGIAMMKNGALVDGRHHAAGEIGRWVWPLNGSGEELHNALSAPVIWRRLAGKPAQAKLPEDLRASLRDFAGHEGAVWDGIVDDYARVIGLLHLLLDSAAYFLHGPLTSLGPRFCADVTRQACELMGALRESPPEIVPSSLGDDAGALGAACLAMEAWRPALH